MNPSIRWSAVMYGGFSPQLSSHDCRKTIISTSNHHHHHRCCIFVVVVFPARGLEQFQWFQCNIKHLFIAFIFNEALNRGLMAKHFMLFAYFCFLFSIYILLLIFVCLYLSLNIACIFAYVYLLT